MRSSKVGLARARKACVHRRVEKEVREARLKLRHGSGLLSSVLCNTPPNCSDQFCSLRVIVPFPGSDPCCFQSRHQLFNVEQFQPNPTITQMGCSSRPALKGQKKKNHRLPGAGKGARFFSTQDRIEVIISITQAARSC